MGDGREGGYIRLYRSVESSEDFVGLRADQCWVAARIVQLANWKPAFHRFRGQAIEVGRGELAHTLETIAERSNSTIKVVRTTVARLIKTGFLGSRTGMVAGTAYRVLIVRNYDKFNPLATDIGMEPGTATGSDRARSGQRPGSDRALREEGEVREEGKNTTAAAGSVTRLPSALPSPEQLSEQRWPLTAQLRDRLAAVRGLTAPDWSWPAPANRDQLEQLIAKASVAQSVIAAAAELDQAAKDGTRIRSLGAFIAPLERLVGQAQGPPRKRSTLADVGDFSKHHEF